MGKRGPKSIAAAERFMDKIELIPFHTCWEWTGATPNHPDGLRYGCFWLNGKAQVASRCSYQLFIGPIPRNICVLHKCDNTSCVNPNHLFLGSHLDNANDREQKGRGRHPNPAKGSRHYAAKITEKNVIEIRLMCESGFTQDVIAKKFCISRSHVSCIVNRIAWRHVS